MTGRFETVVDGEELTIAYTGSGRGAPVVFLHALGRSAADWDTVIADLSSSFRCIAVDLPGHGHSSYVPHYSFELFARATRRLVDHLGLDSFALVGHSMGGTTAWVLAPDLGRRLWAVAIEDTGVPTGRDEYPDVPPAPPTPVDYDWVAVRQIVEQLHQPDPRWSERLGDITAPVLFVAGRTDDEDSDATLSRLPRAEIVTVPVGHWVHQDAPAEFIASVGAFLGRAQPAS